MPQIAVPQSVEVLRRSKQATGSIPPNASEIGAKGQGGLAALNPLQMDAHFFGLVAGIAQTVHGGGQFCLGLA